MSAYLVVMRHGPAEGLGPHHAGDAERRLTPEGRLRTQRACATLSRVVSRLDRVYTSPYLRARETAELLASSLGASGPTVTPLLAPGFERAGLAAMLAEGGEQAIGIVAHEPDLSGFVGWLSGGRVAMGKGTACLTELAAPGTAQLFGVYSLEALNALHGG